VFSTESKETSREEWMVMAVPKRGYVVDDSGKKKAVILDIAGYRRLLGGHA